MHTGGDEGWRRGLAIGTRIGGGSHHGYQRALGHIDVLEGWRRWRVPLPGWDASVDREGLHRQAAVARFPFVVIGIVLPRRGDGDCLFDLG